MKLGRSLWLVIIIKLIVIFVALKIFIYDKSLRSEFRTDEEKSEFVRDNLISNQSSNQQKEEYGARNHR